MMSAVAAGALTQKKRIPASRSQLTFRPGFDFVVDNGGTYDLNTAIDGLNLFPHPGARTFTVGTPTFSEGEAVGTPLTREGDVLTLNDIPFSGNTGGSNVTYGTGTVPISLSIAATHDFDAIPEVLDISGGNLILVHDASDSAFNGGSAVMNHFGEVAEWVCPSPFTGFKCAEFDPFAP
jgi:hypothetical protein